MLSLCTPIFSGVMKTKTERIVAVNDQNLPIGEDHHNAKLTNHEIDLIRKMYEVDKMRPTHIARIFECDVAAIWRICKYKARSQEPIKFKKVKIEVEV